MNSKQFQIEFFMTTSKNIIALIDMTYFSNQIQNETLSNLASQSKFKHALIMNLCFINVLISFHDFFDNKIFEKFIIQFFDGQL